MAYDNKKVYKKPDDRRARYTSLNLTNVNEEKKARLLFWSSLNGNPRINVYLDNDVYGIDSKPDWNKVIIASFKPLDLEEFIQDCKDKIEEDKNDYCEVTCLYPKFNNGVKTDEKTVRAIVRFGKDKNNVWYFYIEEPNKAKIKFDIAPSGWHVARASRDDVNETSVEVRSRKLAKAYLRLLDKLFTADLAGNLKVDIIPSKDFGNDDKKRNSYTPTQNSDVSSTSAITVKESGTDLDSLF